MELPPAMRRVPGRLLYKLRTDAGLTLKALARLTGLAWSSHWRWENDKAPVLPYQYEAVKSLVDKWRKAHPIKKPGKVTLRTV
jgi:transcriptional regulator with XRE-family HTH domain